MQTRISEYRQTQFEDMLADSAELLPLEMFTNVVTDDSRLYGMPFGCVIAPNGDIYQLHVYATHGAVAAILCPEQAEAFGVPQPTGSRDELPVMAYQEFEIECAHLMPLVRISSRFGINISHGRGEFWPTKDQERALKRYLVANDALDDEISTSEGRMRGQAFLQSLQMGEKNPDYMQDPKAREEMKRQADADGRFVAVAPARFSDGGQSNES